MRSQITASLQGMSAVLLYLLVATVALALVVHADGQPDRFSAMLRITAAAMIVGGPIIIALIYTRTRRPAPASPPMLQARGHWALRIPPVMLNQVEYWRGCSEGVRFVDSGVSDVVLSTMIDEYERDIEIGALHEVAFAYGWIAGAIGRRELLLNPDLMRVRGTA